MFVIGGLSGIFMASTPVDIFIQDTYFIVAPHPLRGLRRLDLRRLRGDLLLVPEDVRPDDERRCSATLHFWPTFVFFNLTFFPMHIIGVGGQMRRIYNPMQYEFLQHAAALERLHHRVGACASASAQIPFVVNFFWSLFAGKKAPMNPWNANTLEWSAPSPPPHLNWGPTLPTVYRGPYEYSSPESKEDFLPQWTPPVVAGGARRH